MEPDSASPFDRIRARFLLAWLLGAVGLGIVATVVVWPTTGLDDPLPDAVGALVISLLIFAVPALRARSAGLAVGDLYSPFPPRRRLPRLAALAFPMLGVALVGLYVLYAPLSLAFPGAVEAWLFEHQPVLYSSDRPYPLVGNALGLLAIAVASPIAEEWFFRGLLLRRWVRKWGPARAVVASSLVFALFHQDLLGGFVFGVFMCALCAQHRSLWAPTIVHAANNGLAWCLVAVDTHYPLPMQVDTVAQLRAAWWLPALGLLLLLPWALRTRGRYGPVSSWDFATAPGDAPARSAFRWQPRCDIRGDGQGRDRRPPAAT